MDKWSDDIELLLERIRRNCMYRSEYHRKNFYAIKSREKYFNIPTNRTVQELLEIIKTRYPNILDINFDQKENHQNFWFISKNKEEPRMADRFEEHGSELEQPLAIARDIKKLYEQLLSLKNEPKTIAQFLSL